MKRALLIGAVLVGLLTPGTGTADESDCKVPMAQWQPRQAVMAMAKARGWTVQRLRIDDGCYEIKGRDETGRAIKAQVDPGSLAVIRIKTRDRGEDN